MALPQGESDAGVLIEIETWMQQQVAADEAAAAEEAATQANVVHRGLAPINTVPQDVTKSRSPGLEVDFKGINWIGRLTEYRQANPPIDTTLCVEETVGRAPERFRCTITIAESPNAFGTTSHTFSTKKDAKRYACMEAVEWLIANKYISSNIGSKNDPELSRTKVSILGAPGRAVSSSGENQIPPASSYAKQVADLSAHLGYTPPSYVFDQSPELNSIYSGWAHFAGDPRISGKIGEFRNIFGKKNAKEYCAKQVLAFLQDIQTQRYEHINRSTNAIDGPPQSMVPSGHHDNDSSVVSRMDTDGPESDDSPFVIRE